MFALADGDEPSLSVLMLCLINRCLWMCGTDRLLLRRVDAVVQFVCA